MLAVDKPLDSRNCKFVIKNQLLKNGAILGKLILNLEQSIEKKECQKKKNGEVSYS